MSELPVKIVAIEAVEPHQDPAVERLEVARIGGWTCVVGRGQFKVGDIALFVPDDAVLPPKLVDILFATSKIKPHNGRIRPIRIRGQFSQGLLVKPEVVDIFADKHCIGDDVGPMLGITKYEPPEPATPGPQLGRVRSLKSGANDLFREYTKIRRIEWDPRMFAEGEDVVITEKIHGTNFRAGWLPCPPRWYERALRWLGFAVKPRYEFVVGSHHKQLLQGGKEYGGFYENKVGNVYFEAAEKYDLKSKLRPGEVVYGEVYGSGVQKGYTYGCTNNERRLVIFDVETDIDGERGFLHHYEVEALGLERGIPVVPKLYEGSYSPAAVAAATSGPSVLAPTQVVREGCVVRPARETRLSHGRKIQKSINPDYDMIPVGQRSDNH